MQYMARNSLVNREPLDQHPYQKQRSQFHDHRTLDTWLEIDLRLFLALVKVHEPGTRRY